MNRFEFDICIPATHPAFPGHFPGHPIVPGVLLLDEVLTAAQKLSRREISSLQHVKFLSALKPGERAHVVYEVEGEQATFVISLERNSTSVVLARGKFLMQLQNNEALD